MDQGIKKIILILSVLINIVYADSPITFTKFAKAYSDKIIDIAAASHGVLTNELCIYLDNPNNNIAVKMALINKLGFANQNSSIYKSFIQHKYGYSDEAELIQHIGSDQLLALAYLQAMDNYFDVTLPIIWAKKALETNTDSFTYNIILSLLIAQNDLDKDWCAVYTGPNKIREEFKNVHKDMKDEAISMFFDYLDIYQSYCPEQIELNKKKTIKYIRFLNNVTQSISDMEGQDRSKNGVELSNIFE